MHHIYREKPEVRHQFEATLHLLVLLSLCFDPIFFSASALFNFEPYTRDLAPESFNLHFKG